GPRFSCLSAHGKIQRHDAAQGSSEVERNLAGERFAQYLHAPWSRPAVDNIDLRKRNVWQLLVVPQHRGRRGKEADVQPVVAAFTVQQGNQLIESCWIS